MFVCSMEDERKPVWKQSLFLHTSTLIKKWGKKPKTWIMQIHNSEQTLCYLIERRGIASDGAEISHIVFFLTYDLEILLAIKLLDFIIIIIFGSLSGFTPPLKTRQTDISTESSFHLVVNKNMTEVHEGL